MLLDKIVNNYQFLVAGFLVSLLVGFVVLIAYYSQMKMAKPSRINLNYIDKSKTRVDKIKDTLLYIEKVNSK